MFNFRNDSCQWVKRKTNKRPFIVNFEAKYTIGSGCVTAFALNQL